jgi:hypothetical protein
MGLTCWLDARRLARQSPSKEQVALAEAVGQGDLTSLARLAVSLTPEQLDTPLTNGMSLLDLAEHAGQREAADWLGAHGAKAAPASS